MTSHLRLLLVGIFSLTLFSGCTTKSQPLACFKGSSSCYTQKNIVPHEVKCTTCVAVL